MKRPRLILHIGMHKTGSTTLQRFFAGNRRLLQWLGIDYPKAVTPDGRTLAKHNDYFHAITHEKDHGTPHPFYGASAPMIETLAKSLRPGRVTILSAEGFSGENPAFANAFAPLRDLADISLVCFLRRQDEWATSFYKQMVVSRDVKEFRDFEGFLSLQSTPIHLDYETLLGWWADAIGENSIRIAIYPPTHSVLADFLKAANLPAWLRFLPFANSLRNRSLPSDTIERIRQANAAKLPRPDIQPGDADHPYFTPASRAQFLALYQPANERLRQRFRPDLATLFPC